MPSFQEKVRTLAEKVERNNVWRQKESFNLIPSESTPSLLVKMCEISDPAGRYAEHRTMKGEEVYFYQGIDFIRDVELEAQRELCRYFGCTDVELRPVSGQMANEVVFKGMVKFINRGKADGQTQPPPAAGHEQRPEQGRPPELSAHGRPVQLRRGRPGDGEGERRPLAAPQGQSLQAGYRGPARAPRDAQARAHRLRQKHVPLPGAGQGRGRDRQGLEDAAGPDVRHGPRPRALRRVPGAVQGRRGHRHGKHAQDLLRARSAGSSPGTCPRTARSATSGSTSRAGPSRARPPTTTWGRSSGCSWRRTK